jgi:NADH-quinone oxidoreductase subunit N
VNPLTDPLRTAALAGPFELILPEIALVGTACVLYLAGLCVAGRALPVALALLGLIGAAALAFLEDTALDPIAAPPGVYAPLVAGPAAAFARWLVLGVGFLLLLLAAREYRDTAADYLAALLVALAGTSLVARANDLVYLYLTLELLSIPTYVLLYLPAKGKAGQEAALKYFLLSILSSAVTLFGFSYLYGLAGSTNLSAIGAAFAAANDQAISPLGVFAMVLTIAGLGFRLTAVPFHYYAPDVYQGGPTGVVAQLAVLPKIAGFLALANLLGLTSRPFADLPFPVPTQVPLMLWVLAAATMTLGNALALLQDNLKRVLAYSGVAHAGYMILGLVTATAFTGGDLPRHANGFDAILFYLVAYALMTLGVFAVLAALADESGGVESIDDLAGLHRTHPLAAGVLLLLLLSMIGIPLTAGFSGKLALFFGLYDAPTTHGMGNAYKALVVLAAVNAAIGAVVYLRVLSAAFLRSPLRTDAPPAARGPLAAALLCALGTLAIGIYPQMIWDKARAAGPSTPPVAKSPFKPAPGR